VATKIACDNALLNTRHLVFLPSATYTKNRPDVVAIHLAPTRFDEIDLGDWTESFSYRDLSLPGMTVRVPTTGEK
jgi:hypothetical protein